MRMFLTLLLLLVSGTPAFANAPALLVLGDSLSAGYGIDVERGWVRLLQEHLDNSGQPHRVVNASVSGDTTRNALDRLPTTLQRHQPEVVIVELGGNDGLRGLSLKTMRDNLRAIVRLARDAGARVLLLGVRLPPNYGSAFTQRFAAVFREVAAELEVALVEEFLAGVAEDPRLMQLDRIHPNAEAQPRLLANVLAALMPLLQAPAASAD